MEHMKTCQCLVDQSMSDAISVVVVNGLGLWLFGQLFFLVVQHLLKRIQVLLLHNAVSFYNFRLFFQFVDSHICLERKFCGFIKFLSSLFDPFVIFLHFKFNIIDIAENAFFITLVTLFSLSLEITEQLIHLLITVLGSVVLLKLFIHFFSNLKVHIHSLVVNFFLQSFNGLSQSWIFDVEPIDFRISLDQQIISWIKLNLLSLDQFL